MLNHRLRIRKVVFHQKSTKKLIIIYNIMSIVVFWDLFPYLRMRGDEHNE